ncbi:MAG: hypothetical protein ABEH43_05110 [Flavobacteriales bacterium]
MNKTSDKASIIGFTMVKNATKLYYPIRECIESLLPIVDEFVIALGDCDNDDKTREEIKKISSKKLRIIDTVWDIKKWPNGTENAHQTDIAKSECTSDWCFYLQADEVIHEKYHEEIREKCNKYKNDTDVEGFLFKYIHFWGDYDHYMDSHGWYEKEIRIIRNDPDIHSWQSAQSFRKIPNFDGKDYRKVEGTYKLNVIELDAYVYHYGWVRPPHLMKNKNKALSSIHKGKSTKDTEGKQEVFDYGPLGRLPKFKGTHPKVMQERINEMDWDNMLNKGKKNINGARLKHLNFKNRFMTKVENMFFSGKRLFTFQNWNIINK